MWDLRKFDFPSCPGFFLLLLFVVIVVVVATAVYFCLHSDFPVIILSSLYSLLYVATEVAA